MPKISGYQSFNEHDNRSIVFKKTGAQIREKASMLLAEVSGLIAECETRIRGMSGEMDVADAAELLMRGRGQRRRGKDDEGLMEAMEDLRCKRIDQVRLRAVVENIEPERTFDLTFHELEYYEF